MEHHSYSFFGQKTGIILDSSRLNEPSIYFKFIKKKDNGNWEKPSLKEGKSIKINILELIQIINIFNRQNSKWSTVHKFENDSTSINLSNVDGVISFSISGYMKQIKFPESKLFLDLLHHIYKEKIENLSNSSSKQRISFEAENGEKTIQNTAINMKESSSNISYSNLLDSFQKSDHFIELPGVILDKSSKAISYQVSGYNQIWIPISCIKSNINIADPNINKLWIKEWFLKKKASDIFASAK